MQGSHWGEIRDILPSWAHILEKISLWLKKISLLCIKWDFLSFSIWSRDIPVDANHTNESDNKNPLEVYHINIFW